MRQGSARLGNFTLQVNRDDPSLGGAAGKMSWSHDSTAGNFGALASPNVLPQNSYAHVAVTFAATSIAFYVDGVLVLQYSNPPAPGLNNAAVTIGRGAYNGFVGALDSVRVYNRVLTPAEIAAISADR